MISFEDFQKLDLRVGKILKAENVKNSDKLLRLEVDLGDKTTVIMAGIANDYKNLEKLVGKQIVVIANIKPRTILGVESSGMLLGAESKDGRYYLLKPDQEVTTGTKIL